VALREITAIMGCARLFGLSCDFKRGCGASSLVVPAVHGDVEAQPALSPAEPTAEMWHSDKTEFCSSLKGARRVKMSERALKSL
jgi:hypothetical protein